MTVPVSCTVVTPGSRVIIAGACDGQFGGAAAEALPVLYGQQVGAQGCDLGQQPGLGRGATGPAPPRSRPPRSRSPAPTARPAACGCVARPRPAGPGRRAAAGRRAARGAGVEWTSWLASWCQTRTGATARGPPGEPLCGGGGVGDDPAVEHLDLPRHPGGDGLVVGDHHDRRSLGVELLEQGQQRLRRWPGPGCRWARRRARSPVPRQRPGDRDPLPLTARQLGRPRVQLVRRARPGASACAAGRRRSASPAPAYSSPSATLSSAVACSARKNCWNTNPIEVARSPASCRSDRPSTSRPVTRTVPAGPVQRAHQVQQRRLARPRRADAPPPARPAATAKLTRRSAITGGEPG